MIDIINRQQTVDILTTDFETFIKSAIKKIPKAKDHSINVVFVSDFEINTLNKLFRGKDSVTDVLSFPETPDEFDQDILDLGEIVISAEQAKRQAIENGLSLELEIKQLILHGILHLCGFDHETDKGEMNELELKLRDKLGIN